MSDFFKKTKEEQIKKLKDWYVNQSLSTVQIAKELDTYPKKVERQLKKFGIPLRNRSEAQKNSLEQGTAKHPTEGKERPLETKIKIAKKIADVWENMDDEELARRAKMSKDNYEGWSDQAKAEFREKSKKAIKEAADSGSKLEKYLSDKLQNAGFIVETHRKHAVSDKKLHIDMVLPEHMIAIEIDGITHRQNVYGQADLNRTIMADSKKNGLLISNGYKLIRVKQDKTFSLSYGEKIYEKLIKTVESLKTSKPQVVKI